MTESEETWRPLAEALQGFASALADHEGREPVLVAGAVLVWEEASYGPDGRAQRQVHYCVPADDFSPSAVLGLLSAGQFFVRRDVLGGPDDPDGL